MFLMLNEGVYYVFEFGMFGFGVSDGVCGVLLLSNGFAFSGSSSNGFASFSGSLLNGFVGCVFVMNFVVIGVNEG